jgi:hypothetical protein
LRRLPMNAERVLRACLAREGADAH